jgi:hypothetical protein
VVDDASGVVASHIEDVIATERWEVGVHQGAFELGRDASEKRDGHGLLVVTRKR